MASILKALEVIEPENWGIQPVPADRRRLRAFDLSVLWGDLAVSLLVMIAGALLVDKEVLALGTKDAMLAILVGTLLGAAVLSLAGIVGSTTGVPTMVGLRACLGIRGSYIGSAVNVLQLVGWAAIEIIVMAQAAKSLSDHYLGFSGYYLWLVFFGALGMAMAVGGPVSVVRQFMQKFGIWVVLVAAAWLTYRLFAVYDMGELWRAKGGGGSFWLGVDLVVSLPVSWLPLVGDYSRFAGRPASGAVGTYIGYSIANIWFFALGMFYVLALQGGGAGNLVPDLVTMLLPLTLGWFALIVLLVGESDEAFANIYSTAVSIRNLAPRLTHTMLAVVVGIAAVIVAMVLDRLGWAASYENFLLLIGGIFVPLFGVFLADYFVVRGRRYEVAALYGDSGIYWYATGVNFVGVGVWLGGFVLYALAAQPTWLVANLDFVSWAPGKVNFISDIGGTIPAFVFSFVAYSLLGRALVGARKLSPVLAR